MAVRSGARRQKVARLTDVDAVVVPVAAGHTLVDIGVDARHFAGRTCRTAAALAERKYDDGGRLRRGALRRARGRPLMPD